MLTEYANGLALMCSFLAGLLADEMHLYLFIIIWKCVIYGFIDLWFRFNVFDESIQWIWLTPRFLYFGSFL